MRWDEDLLDDQKQAACHSGCHARLLAGPGTGKTLTLTRRAAYLVSVQGVPPGQILALTFTRAAASVLRNRVASVLGDQDGNLPRVSTLHSFALRQLLRNSDRIETVPQPLRIADDWEERNIIQEDLKALLGYDLGTVQQRFNLLSADWQTLAADEAGWETGFVDPRFLGAWRKHRTIFGYALRSELVYQLKRALEQSSEFSLESEYLHLLVDEYQDMNRCDLAVLSAIRDKGAEVFGAGDDDQSIYGFRFAHPEGIRRFATEHVPSRSLTLGTCVRCDRKIIDFSLFVANLDPDRLPKPLVPRDGAGEGEVHILRFGNQELEAQGVARICKHLVDAEGYRPADILILMRSDRNEAFSSVVKQALEAAAVPVAIQAASTPLDTNEGRVFLSVLRLLADESDGLALRTLLMLGDNGIGRETCSRLYSLAVASGATFSETVRRVALEPQLIPRVGSRLRNEIERIDEIVNQHRDRFGGLADSAESGDLLPSLGALAEQIIERTDVREDVIAFLESIVEEARPANHIELLRVLSSSLEDEEQELDTAKVNIMTMHKAKGLTAKAVIIIAAEDEYLPGRQAESSEGDERRLLYVSLSRARHFLFVSYCERRTGQQRHTGRTSGQPRRTLTRFLRDAPIRPVDGSRFVTRLGQESAR
jgi:DNA helicase-2/ATP-dependent DNA helicase PcrA